MHRLLRLPWVLLVLATGLAADNPPGIQEALAALRRGDFASAERTLQAEIRARPDDAAALTLLGVALDNQRKFQEAGEIHRRAAASAPDSADVWNNYANHLLGTGDDEGARKLYLRALAIDPAQFNANAQLMRLALKQKKGLDALQYLQHLPSAQQDAANLAPMRLQALYLAGRSAEAAQLAARWLAAAKGDLAANFALGVAAAEAGQLEPAEQFFSQALAVAPADFNVLFNLGVVEWHAGHLDRARDLLQAAERQQPQNVDLLYTLAAVLQSDHQSEQAVAVLARAARLAPARADVQRLLALATGDLGALDDSAAAWERYLQLVPTDDVARRERGFTAFRMGRFEQAFGDLRWFVARHPDDPVGHFELATAENVDNPAEALPEFDRAVALQSDFAAARSARGNLYYQMGKPEAALADLEAAAAIRPDDAVTLDRLGQTYLALERSADALRVLRQAAALAPTDSKTQFHLARALADAGLAADSKAAMDRFRQLGPAVNRGVPGGLVDYLNLTPEQRRADYRKRVERVVREHPEDASGQLNYLRLLVEDGDAAHAAEVARKLAALQPAPAVLADAGRALIDAGQYRAAQELLEKAGAPLDLAVAAFHASGPAEGLRRLDAIPDSARDSDYYLARAEMLEAADQAAEASTALDRALAIRPVPPAVYLRACILLLRHRRMEQALRVSGDAARGAPQDRRMLLLRAVVLESAGRTAEAQPLLHQAQNRWPEWAPAWTAEGMLLAAHGHTEESQAALRTASALGAASPPPDLTGLLRPE